MYIQLYISPALTCFMQINMASELRNSTELALSELVDRIYTDLDENNYL